MLDSLKTIWQDRWLKFFAILLGLSYLVIGLVFVAERVVQVKLPRYVSNLEDELLRLTGYRWEFDAFAISYRGLNPVISVGHLKALIVEEGVVAEKVAESKAAESEDSVIQVRDLEVYIDLARTLLNRQAILYGVRAAEVDIDLQNKNGRWMLPGVSSGSSVPSFNWRSFIGSLRYVDFHRLGLNLRQSVVSELPDLVFKYRYDNRHHGLIFEQAEGPDDTELRIHAMLVEDELSLDGYSFDMYAASAQHGLSRWLNAFFVNSEIKQLAGEVFLSKQSGKPYQGVVSVNEAAMTLSRIAADRTAGIPDRAPDLPSGFVVTPFSVLLEQPAEKVYSFVWPRLVMKFSGEPIQFDQGRLSWSDSAGFNDMLSLEMSSLNLDYLNYTLTGAVTWERVFGAPLIGILRDINPAGQINNFSLTLPISQPGRFQAIGFFNNVSLDPFRSAPGGSGIRGAFALTRNTGSVQLDSRQSLALEFPSIYAEPLVFGQGEGRVSWSIAGGRILVQGKELSLTGLASDSQYAANFFVNGRVRGDDASTLTLEIGVEEGDAEELLDFVPEIAPESVKNWLAQANLKGSVTRGGFLFNGSLHNGEEEKRSIDMFFDLAGAELNYQPDWPRVNGLDGSLMIQGDRVQLHAARAESMQLALTDIVLDIRDEEVSQKGRNQDKHQDKQFLSVDLKLAGNTSDLIELLKIEPLQEITGGALANWEASGQFGDGSLHLGMPLGEFDPKKLSIQTWAQLTDSVLQMRDFNIDLDLINGKVGFSSEAGLQSQGLTASLWRAPVIIDLGSREMGAEIIDVIASGRIALVDLESWLDFPLKNHFTGAAKAQFGLLLGGDNSKITLNSDLLGVDIALPGAYAKTPDASRELQLEWQFAGVDQPMSIQVAELGLMTMAFRDGEFDGAVMEFLEKNKLNTMEADELLQSMRDQYLYASNHLTFTGTVGFADFEEWLPTIALYAADDETIENSASIESGIGASGDTDGGKQQIAVRGRDLQIENLTLWGQKFTHTGLDFEHFEQGWNIEVINDKVNGRIFLPDALDLDLTVDASTGKISEELMPSLPNPAIDQPRIGIDFTYLKLDSAMFAIEDSEGMPEISQGVDAGQVQEVFLAPESLYPLDVSLGEFFWNSESLGSWEFQLTASKSAALIHNISASPYELTLKSDSDDGLLWAYDETGSLLSTLNLELTSRNFGGFLQKFGGEEAEQPMVSELMSADLSLNWPGPPDAFEQKQLEGEVDFEFEKGRFFKASQSATGLLKLLGLINFDTLLRRVQLDFADVYKEGLSFDRIGGVAKFSKNKILFNEVPIEMKAPSSSFKLLGEVDLGSNEIEAELIATLPVASNLPWIAALAGGLPVAAGTYVVTQVFGDQFSKLSSASYYISGDLNDPDVKFGRLFKSNVRSAGGQSEAPVSVESKQQQ